MSTLWGRKLEEQGVEGARPPPEGASARLSPLTPVKSLLHNYWHIATSGDREN